MGIGPELLVLEEEAEAPLAEGGRYSMRRPGRIFSLVMIAWSWKVFLLVRVLKPVLVRVRVLVDATGSLKEDQWIDDDDDNDDGNENDGEKATMQLLYLVFAE
mmetsp:Transcript_31514/g.35741  ORF Transcript_31514/g.35741 Transcript_31514/m.35741 type:complete len:103 (+) Transcript_31514:2482-2790(+)